MSIPALEVKTNSSAATTSSDDRIKTLKNLGGLRYPLLTHAGPQLNPCSVVIDVGALGRIDNRKLIRDNAALRPGQETATESSGPYYIAGTPARRDVREDRKGAALTLRVRVVDVMTGEPLPGVVSGEIWHADAHGHYSGYLSYLPERIPALFTMVLRRFRPTDSSRFLRGHQYADSDGVIEFLTIVPGWYTPRTLHIHFKVRENDAEVATTEFYLPDWVREETQAAEPYAQREPGMFNNANDAEIRWAKGAPGCWPDVAGTAGEGYLAEVTVKVRTGK